MVDVSKFKNASTDDKPKSPRERFLAIPGASAVHPLNGAGVHFKDENGRVENQMVILNVVPSNSPAGDLALVQYFDWMMGDRSTRALIPLAQMTDPKRWVFYADIEEMNEHYERVDGPKNRGLERQLAKKAGGEEGKDG
jgi:hypothetical protein